MVPHGLPQVDDDWGDEAPGPNSAGTPLRLKVPPHHPKVEEDWDEDEGQPEETEEITPPKKVRVGPPTPFINSKKTRS